MDSNARFEGRTTADGSERNSGRHSNEMNGEGMLKINVTEAGGTIPIENAVVLIYEYERDESDENAGEILYSLRTDEGGSTPTVSLAAPSSAESLIQGYTRPYGIYNITVSRDGYYTAEGIGVPVFDGIKSIQAFDLLPLSEKALASGRRGRITVLETPESRSLSPYDSSREDIGSTNGILSGGINISGIIGMGGNSDEQ